MTVKLHFLGPAWWCNIREETQNLSILLDPLKQSEICDYLALYQNACEDFRIWQLKNIHNIFKEKLKRSLKVVGRFIVVCCFLRKVNCNLITIYSIFSGLFAPDCIYSPWCYFIGDSLHFWKWNLFTETSHSCASKQKFLIFLSQGHMATAII